MNGGDSVNQTGSLLIGDDDSRGYGPDNSEMRFLKPDRKEKRVRPKSRAPTEQKADLLNSMYVFRKYLAVRNTMAFAMTIVVFFLLMSFSLCYHSTQRNSHANRTLMVTGMALSIVVSILYVLSCFAWEKYRRVLQKGHRILHLPRSNALFQFIVAVALLVHPSYWTIGVRSNGLTESFYRKEFRFDLFSTDLNVYGYLFQLSLYTLMLVKVLSENQNSEGAQSQRVSRMFGVQPNHTLTIPRFRFRNLGLALLGFVGLGVFSVYLINFAETGYFVAINRADFFSDSDFAAEFLYRSVLLPAYNSYWFVLNAATRVTYGDLILGGALARVFLCLVVLGGLYYTVYIVSAVEKALRLSSSAKAASLYQEKRLKAEQKKEASAKVAGCVIRAKLAKKRGNLSGFDSAINEARVIRKEIAKLSAAKNFAGDEEYSTTLLGDLKGVSMRIAAIARRVKGT